MESKYLEKFRNVKSSPLRGNRLIVEVLPKEELKTASGLLIADSLENVRSSTTENRSDLAIILMVGSGYYDDKTGKDVALDVRPGNVVHLPKMSFRFFSDFPGLSTFVKNEIALVREDEIISKWEDIQEYEAYKAALNT